MKRFVIGLLAFMLVAAPALNAQKRISFPTGRTTAILKGRTTGGPSESGGMKPVSYRLRARKGQQMTLHLTSAKKNAIFSVYLPGMEPMTGAAWESTDYSGTLPKSGDYEIMVYPKDEMTNTTFTLEVTIR
jgi:hypothetical protein